MIEETRTIYRCPYCSKEYDYLCDAQECAEECADVESPEEDEESIFVCEYCGEKSSDECIIEECENKHKEMEDEYFHKVELRKASEHPSQQRLIVTAGGSE